MVASNVARCSLMYAITARMGSTVEAFISLRAGSRTVRTRGRHQQARQFRQGRK